MKILMIEDSPQVVDSVQICLKIGMSETKLVTASEGGDGIALVRSESPDVVLLDLGLPDMEGIEVLKAIRRLSSVPVIVLTVRDSEIEVAQGLDLGATDYITKPFRPLELIARIKSALRGSHFPLAKEAAPIVLGRLTLDDKSRSVVFNHQPLHLTPNEYQLLYCLVRHSPQVVSPEIISEQLWNDKINRTSSIKSLIWQLRDKLGDKQGKTIESVRGLGYRFNP